VYLGPPLYIVHNLGTNFALSEFRSNALTIGSEVKEMPTEAHNSIGLVKRYYIPLWRAFDIVSKELPQLGKEERL
jgi:hypothetical protein